MPDGEPSRSLCIFCGEDAPLHNLRRCPDCGRQPETANDVAYAIAFSSAVMNDDSLDRLSEHMKSGKSRPRLGAEMYEELLEFAQSIDLDHLFAGIAQKEGEMH